MAYLNILFFQNIYPKCETRLQNITPTNLTEITFFKTQTTFLQNNSATRKSNCRHCRIIYQDNEPVSIFILESQQLIDVGFIPVTKLLKNL